MLVALDGSDNGRFASRLAGWLIGARDLAATILEMRSTGKDSQAEPQLAQSVIETAEATAQVLEGEERLHATKTKGESDDPINKGAKTERTPVRELVSIVAVKAQDDTRDNAEAILAEAKKGYGMLFLGLDTESKSTPLAFSTVIEKIVREFTGSIAIALNSRLRDRFDAPLEKILVPTTGVDYSRFGVEVAVAIAKGCGATITALNISAPPAENELLRRPNQLLRTGRALLADVVALGERENVRVNSKALVGPAKGNLILRQASLGAHQLIVLGTKAWSGDPLHFGQSVQILAENAPCPILIVRT